MVILCKLVAYVNALEPMVTIPSSSTTFSTNCPKAYSPIVVINILSLIWLLIVISVSELVPMYPINL